MAIFINIYFFPNHAQLHILKIVVFKQFPWGYISIIDIYRHI